MTECPKCHSPMCEYSSGIWRELICWECGHYESDTPAYKVLPELFEGMVRKNPKKFLLKSSDDGLQGGKSDEDLTEP